MLRGGEGMPGSWGVVMPSMGVMEPENMSLGSATEGDWRGDWTYTCLVFADASSMRGGRSGVVANPSSCSPLLRLARSTSMTPLKDRSSRPSKTLFVGVGGNCPSMYD